MTTTKAGDEAWMPKDSLALTQDRAAHDLWLNLIGQATWTVRDLRGHAWHPKEGDGALERLLRFGLLDRIWSQGPRSPTIAAKGQRVVGWKLTPKGVEWATETLGGALISGHVHEDDLPGWIANAVVEVATEQVPRWREQLDGIRASAKAALRA